MLPELFDLSEIMQALPQSKVPSGASSSQKEQEIYLTDVAPTPPIKASSKKGNITLSYHI